MIRTQEQLKLWFQLEKEKRLKQQQKQKERIKQIKAQEKERKLKHKQHLAKLEKEAQKALKQPQIEIRTTLHIYKTTNLIDRAPSEDELYLTREELQQAEQRGEGKINWNAWNKLVEEGRNENKRKRR